MWQKLGIQAKMRRDLADSFDGAPSVLFSAAAPLRAANKNQTSVRCAAVGCCLVHCSDVRCGSSGLYDSHLQWWLLMASGAV